MDKIPRNCDTVTAFKSTLPSSREAEALAWSFFSRFANAMFRACGYSIDQEEHVTGLNCIASAVYDDVGSVVAAISISGPASRLTPDRFVSQGELVRETARNISTALGLKPQAD